MAELKTKQTRASVEKFLDAIKDEESRRDCFALLEMMKRATKSEPRMWGASIVGFGDYRYTYASGRAGDWFIAGFSPRKQALSLYLASCMYGIDRYAPLLAKLGRHKTGVGCLYIRRLSDVDRAVLKRQITVSVADSKKPRP